MKIENFLEKVGIKLHTPIEHIEYLMNLAQNTNGIIVEIGTANLGTTIPLAIAAPLSKIVTIDTYNTSLANTETYVQNLNILLNNSINNVYLIKGNSYDIGKIFEKQIDFVWIDGNHEGKYVKIDIETWSSKLKNGGIICGDDYNHPLHPDLKIVINELIRDNDTYSDFKIFKNRIWSAIKK